MKYFAFLVLLTASFNCKVRGVSQLAHIDAEAVSVTKGNFIYNVTSATDRSCIGFAVSSSTLVVDAFCLFELKDPMVKMKKPLKVVNQRKSASVADANDSKFAVLVFEDKFLDINNVQTESGSTEYSVVSYKDIKLSSADKMLVNKRIIGISKDLITEDKFHYNVEFKGKKTIDIKSILVDKAGSMLGLLTFAYDEDGSIIGMYRKWMIEDGDKRLVEEAKELGAKFSRFSKIADE